MEIGDRLRFLREDKGLNQREFANLLGISQQNLSNYEKNKRDIPELVKIKLQQNGVNLNWLISGVEEPFIKPNIEPPKPAILQELENIVDEQTAPRFAEHEIRLNHFDERLYVMEGILKHHAEAIDAIQHRRDALEQRLETIEEIEPEDVEGSALSSITNSETVAPVKKHLVLPKKKASYIPEVDEYTDAEESVDLPLALNLAAGIPIEAVDTGDTYPVPLRLIPKKPDSRYCVAKIKGDSMTDAGISDGSYVLLEYFDEPINNEFMVVKYGSETTLKLLRRSKRGGWELLYQDGSGRKIELKKGDWDVKGKFVCVL